MKERHPIDDLFRKGLYDSEATPPADVWERVVAQRSWAHRLLVGLQRHWAFGLVGAAFIAAPLAWYAVEGTSDAAPATIVAEMAVPSATPKHATETNGQVSSASERQAVRPLSSEQPANAQATVVKTAGSTSTVSDSSREGDATSSSAPAPEPSRGAARGMANNNGRASSAEPTNAERSSVPEKNGAAVHEPVALVATVIDPTGDPLSTEKDGAATGFGETGSAPPSQPGFAMSDDYVDEEFLRTRTLPFAYDREEPQGSPEARPVEAPYVLPNGVWWIGLQVTLHDRKGGWRGNAPIREDLHKAEEWQSGWEAGVVGGRNWKSGWGLSTGFVFGGLKSRFAFNQPAEIAPSDSSSITYVADTTWSVNAVAPDSSYVVYSYDIAMVPVGGGEQDVKYNATNRYTTLNIPMEVSYQWNIKRWTVMPRIGATMNAFIGRKGRTLTRTALDERSIAVTLNDASVRDRTSWWITGSAGADLGFALDERWQLFGGIGWSTVITALGSKDVQPATSGPQVRFRIAHEFGMKQRKQKE